MVIKKKKFNLILIISSLILLIGISANLYYYFTSCDYIVKRFVKREIKKAQSDKRFFIIYVINSVNTGCGVIPYFDKIKKRGDTYIKIYVKDDFTETDVINLRDAFSIEKSIRIEKPGKEFTDIYTTCIYEYESGNFMIGYDKKTEKLNIRGGF